MSDEPTPTSANPLSKTMPDFYNSQNEEIKMVIAGIFKKYTDLEEFARIIMSMKSGLNNPDAFDKWMENEEIEFKKPPIQEDIKRGSTSQSIPTTTTDSSPSNPYIKTITSEASENPNICDAIAIDIGTSKCKIAICKEKYIQVVEHESNRSVPSYVALSEQNEWLVGRMAENYAVCLQNVIYVNDYVKSAMKRIVDAMSSSTATQDQPEDQPETKKSRSEHDESSQQQGSENQTKIQDKSDERTPWDSIKIELIDEPIAVAAAYAPRLNIHPEGDVALVFCMGAGYLQVAAYFIREKTHEKKANWTDLIITQISGIEPIVDNFAGDEIDRRIFDKMMEKLTDQNGNKEPKLSERAKRRLKIACEKMKCALSFAPHTRIDVDSLYRSGDEDRDLVEVIQKDEIIEYYHDKVYQIIEEVGEVYKEVKPKFVLLAGGSTRIPLITKHLESVFNGSTICSFLNVDEVAVNGAAAIVSKTVTVAEKPIEEQEKKEEVPAQAQDANADGNGDAGADANKEVPTSDPGIAKDAAQDGDGGGDANPNAYTRVSTSDADTKVLDQGAAQDVAKNGDRDGDSHENVDAGAAKGTDGDGDTDASANKEVASSAQNTDEVSVQDGAPTQKGVSAPDTAVVNQNVGVADAGVLTQNADGVLIQDANGMSTPDADAKVPAQDANAGAEMVDPASDANTTVLTSTPADNIPIPDKRHDGDNQLAEVVIKDHQYNPVRNLLFKIRAHLKIIDLNIVASHMFSQFHQLIVVYLILSSYIIVNDWLLETR
ncbi:hypothetical protein WR25_19188 [Diploscapter pachys]|uniref:Uncharacterized protein n=1 Tax=Diploscapter pachys TaxID=2018661 RepID=A0A2A2JFC7_9BILA|nr:hypothetical protein WR25_19188 [Diploscapter pachys]